MPDTYIQIEFNAFVLFFIKSTYSISIPILKLLLIITLFLTSVLI
jgi:hypothetical protein